MFGAFAPFPLRLGPLTLNANQFLRLTNDAAAVTRTAPFAVVRVNNSQVVLYYMGRNGVGVGHAPVATSDSGGTLLTWPVAYTDELGAECRISITRVRVYPEGDLGLAKSDSIVRDATSVWGKATTPGGAPVGAILLFVVYARVTRDAEDYGGYRDKENSIETAPYAADYYRSLQGAMGDAYSTELTGLLHAENLTEARMLGYAHRMSEKLACQQNPGTASSSLARWCQLLDVRSPTSELDGDARARAIGAYQALASNTPDQIRQMCSDTLGSWFVKLWTPDETMTPATPTYWPGINPGPSAYDIGGGCWLSAHARYLVEVVEPTDDSWPDLSQKLDALREILDVALPAHMMWDWSCNVDDGFRLDYGRLDFEGLGA